MQTAVSIGTTRKKVHEKKIADIGKLKNREVA